MKLSIVIPSFKEAENLEIVLPKLSRSLGMLDIESEIIVVDSPLSNDNTLEICNKYGAKHLSPKFSWIAAYCLHCHNSKFQNSTIL